MAEDQYARVLWEIAELKRKLAGMVRPATVHEVKEDRMRMVIGKDANGKDVLGPWLDTSNHRGGARERKFYKKGQNLMLICPNGDLAQAVITPYAPNKNFKAPDHASNSGQDEETYQLEKTRSKIVKDAESHWLQDPEKEDQQQQQQQGDSKKTTKPPDRKPQKPDAKVAYRMSEKGFTGRHGKNSRIMAGEKGSKVKYGGNYVVAADGKVISKASGPNYWHGSPPTVNEPPVLGGAPADPVADDDDI